LVDCRVARVDVALLKASAEVAGRRRVGNALVRGVR
jgi:hypothetical protein